MRFFIIGLRYDTCISEHKDLFYCFLMPGYSLIVFFLPRFLLEACTPALQKAFDLRGWMGADTFYLFDLPNCPTLISPDPCPECWGEGKEVPDNQNTLEAKRGIRSGLIQISAHAIVQKIILFYKTVPIWSPLPREWRAQNVESTFKLKHNLGRKEYPENHHIV